MKFNVLSLSLLLSLSARLFTAPLTDKPPKILFPSESQMSVIEMAIGKETRLIPHSGCVCVDVCVSVYGCSSQRLCFFRFVNKPIKANSSKVGPVLLTPRPCSECFVFFSFLQVITAFYFPDVGGSLGQLLLFLMNNSKLLIASVERAA